MSEDGEHPAAEASGSSGAVLASVREGRLSIVLNRPAVANALTPEQRDQLIGLFNSASIDPRVRVVTIASTGRHFSAGMDLRGPASTTESDLTKPDGVGPERYPGLTMRSMTDAQALIGAVLDCMKPVVTAVQGAAAGMGLYLALASDLIVASTDAVFIEPFVARGMVVHCGGAHLLVSRLGVQRAKEFVLCGGRMDAREAYQLGLVNRLVELGELNAAAEALASQVASGPTIALGLSKRLLNRAVGADRTTAFSEEALAMEVNSATRDADEGLIAFRERRSPEFRGW
jgi:2-(1,2-epoxy-1,2-dihydrophenyl)acetyl-CoA isomerase